MDQFPYKEGDMENLFQLFKKRIQCLIHHSRFQITLPEGNHLPAFIFQSFDGFEVVFYVVVYFIQPPFGARLGYYIVAAAFMAEKLIQLNIFDR